MTFDQHSLVVLVLVLMDPNFFLLKVSKISSSSKISFAKKFFSKKYRAKPRKVCHISGQKSLEYHHSPHPIFLSLSISLSLSLSLSLSNSFSFSVSRSLSFSPSFYFSLAHYFSLSLLLYYFYFLRPLEGVVHITCPSMGKPLRMGLAS